MIGALPMMTLPGQLPQVLRPAGAHEKAFALTRQCRCIASKSKVWSDTPMFGVSFPIVLRF